MGSGGSPPGQRSVPPGQHRAAGGSESEFVTAETEGRVYNVGGQDWDDVVQAAPTESPRSGSSSTWGRSIRPRTGCSG